MPVDQRTSHGRHGDADLPRPASFKPLNWLKRLSLPGRFFVFIGVALLALCVFFAEENWRGRRAWETCRRELEAKGVLNWQRFIPLPVPDDAQNFAMTPFLAPLFDFNPRPRQRSQSIWRDVEGHERAANFAASILPMNSKGELPPARFDGTLTDLEGAISLLGTESNRPAIAASFSSRSDAATAVLAALTQFEPVLSELRSASKRAYSRFNVEYDAEDPVTILLPHYLVLQRTARVLEVRASAELALAKSDAAFNDAALMHFLADSIQNEPFMVCLTARASTMKRTDQIVWEGLANRSWSESQLREFQGWFEKFDQLKALQKGLQSERAAFGVATFQYLHTHKNELRMWLGSDEMRPLAYLLAGPDGWFYQEQVTFHRLYEKRVLAGFNPDSGRLQPRAIDRNREALQRDLNRSLVLHHTGFARLLCTNLIQTFEKAAIAQDRANQTIVACGLERYRLATGRYPESLDALVPRFIDQLPMDVCNGQPDKYRLVNQSQFLLYGVGWNETDDNGTVAMKSDGSDTDPNRGDWVWPQYPQTKTAEK
jgi:hypothetical protein